MVICSSAAIAAITLNRLLLPWQHCRFRQPARTAVHRATAGYPLSKYMRRFIGQGQPLHFIHHRRNPAVPLPPRSPSTCSAGSGSGGPGLAMPNYLTAALPGPAAPCVRNWKISWSRKSPSTPRAARGNTLPDGRKVRHHHLRPAPPTGPGPRLPEREIGYAGLKDARAITRQTVSVPHRHPADVAGLNLPASASWLPAVTATSCGSATWPATVFAFRIHRPGATPSPGPRRFLPSATARRANRFGDQRYGQRETPTASAGRSCTMITLPRRRRSSAIPQ